jgi:hypothetical protein
MLDPIVEGVTYRLTQGDRLRYGLHGPSRYVVAMSKP